MKPLISEFSYGYALTEELAKGRAGSLCGAPVFPSLIEEGRSGGGYDVQLPRIGMPLFLQFKLSHHMKNGNAAEWNLFGSSYYRIYLRPAYLSMQHQLLQALENDGNEVYYAAPEFHRLDELNEAYLNDTVYERSAFFRPLDIRLPDDKEHYVVFSKASSIAWRCSEEPTQEISKTSGKRLLEHLTDAVKKKGRIIDNDFFDSLARNLLQVLERSSVDVDLVRNEKFLTEENGNKFLGRQLVGYLARSYFDAELVIITKSEGMERF